jgi:hypothetical protein
MHLFSLLYTFFLFVVCTQHYFSFSLSNKVFARFQFQPKRAGKTTTNHPSSNNTNAHWSRKTRARDFYNIIGKSVSHYYGSTWSTLLFLLTSVMVELGRQSERLWVSRGAHFDDGG